MKKLGDIFSKFAIRYVAQFQVPSHHLKVIDAICNCRTVALGGHAWACTSCGGIHVHYNSCGNRHCPNCQAFEKEKWVVDISHQTKPPISFKGCQSYQLK